MTKQTIKTNNSNLLVTAFSLVLKKKRDTVEWGDYGQSFDGSRGTLLSVDDRLIFFRNLHIRRQISPHTTIYQNKL